MMKVYEDLFMTCDSITRSMGVIFILSPFLYLKVKTNCSWNIVNDMCKNIERDRYRKQHDNL